MRHILLAVMAAMLVAAQAKADEHCTLKVLASLPISELPERPVVDVTILGKTYHFLVDTGGAYTEIDDDVVQALHLTKSPAPVEVYGMAGDVSTTEAAVPDFEIGPFKADNALMIVQKRDPNDPGIDGVIGPDYLSYFDLDFDFASKKLNLVLPDHCPGNVVYWASEYADADFSIIDRHINMTMNLDGKEISAILDTGSNDTLMNASVMELIFGIDQHSPAAVALPDVQAGDPVKWRTQFNTLSMGGLAINHPNIYVFDDLATKAYRWRHNDKTDFDPMYATTLRTPKLILGMNVLTKLHLYISYKEHKIYLTSADAHPIDASAGPAAAPAATR